MPIVHFRWQDERDYYPTKMSVQNMLDNVAEFDGAW